MSAEWWRTGVVYQVYPRSFADSNGDGIGDLVGLRHRLDYLTSLHIDAIWLTPFYPSPLADGGYDITDHRDVDPRLGTLSDFDDLISAAHGHGIKVLIDIVPNHTSDQHPWFVEALAAGCGADARRRYIFRDGKGPAKELPPSDWRSHFGGSGWEPLPDGQWYFHLFAREQPDLNWDNDEVREDLLRTLKFWADRGVDGFRVDVAHSLTKDLSEPLRSQPNLDTQLPVDGSDPLYDRDEVHEVYRSWRKVFDGYEPPRMAVAETWTPTNERTYLYARPSELGQVFDFSLIKSPWDANHFANVIRKSMADHLAHADDGGGLTWVLSSHDVVRHASRLALPYDVPPESWLHPNGPAVQVDPSRGLRRARAATLLMLALPGSAYLFQGEELGLPEVADLDPRELHDPMWHRSGNMFKGRDGCRVPLPWQHDQPYFGFSTAKPWLRQPEWFGAYAADLQDTQPDSTLALYRTALKLRRDLCTDDNQLIWMPGDHPDVLHVRRSNGWECMVNFGDDPQPIADTRIVLASGTLAASELPPDTAIWLAPADTYVS